MNHSHGNLAVTPSLHPTHKLWAKTDPHRPNDYLPLLGHMLDTYAMALALLERHPHLEKTLSEKTRIPVEVVRPLISTLIALHDMGKAFPAFQQLDSNRYRAAIDAGLPAPKFVMAQRHDALTYPFIHDALTALNWDPTTVRHISEALAGHHGFRVPAGRKERVTHEYALPRLTPSAWKAAAHQLIEEFLATTNTSLLSGIRICAGDFAVLLNGLTTLADWLASDTRHFPITRTTTSPTAYLEDAHERAAATLTRHNWPGPEPVLADDLAFGDIFGFEPRPLQETVADLAAQATEPSIMLIEAPTGEGKTEAALYASLLWQRTLGHRGAYVGMPTQATGNANFARLRGTLERLAHQHGDVRTELHLVHGTSILNRDYQALSVPDHKESDAEGVRASSFFTNRKRALLANFGVGTLDQALLGVLHVRHHTLRLWGLANKTVIIDEVHAYDVYTQGLIRKLVRWLNEIGSSVIMLSATLPPQQRKELLEATGTRFVNEAAYPRVTMVQPWRMQVRSFPTRRHRTTRLSGAPSHPAALAPYLVGHASKGACVIMYCNTVDRAQRLYRHVQALNPGTPVTLFHSRYPVKKRAGIERSIEWRYGPHAKRGGRRPEGGIVIATQVAEQSLDIDFDFVVTDPAPVDLLVQRAGRGHRHDGRTRPVGYEQPHVAIVDFHPHKPPQLKHGTNVYQPFVQLKTWFALHDTNQIELPTQLDDLICDVYNDTIPPDLDPELRSAFMEAHEELGRARDAMRSELERVVIPDPNEYYEMPFAPELLEEDDPRLSTLTQAATRLAPPNVTVVFLHQRKDGSLTLTPRGGKPVDLTQLPSGTWEREVFSQSVRLSRKGVVQRILESGEPPPAWKRSPLLRYCYPVVLRGGGTYVGKTHVRLDPQLGVVFDNAAGAA